MQLIRSIYIMSKDNPLPTTSSPSSAVSLAFILTADSASGNMSKIIAATNTKASNFREK